MIDITVLIVLLIISNCLVISFNLWEWAAKRLKQGKKQAETKGSESNAQET